MIQWQPLENLRIGNGDIMFYNVGNRVECIDAEHGLVNGDAYTIRETDTDGTVKVEGFTRWFNESRFKIAKKEKEKRKTDEYSFSLGSDLLVDWQKLREESLSLETPVAHINILNKDYILVHNSVYNKAMLIGDDKDGDKLTFLEKLRKLGASFEHEEVIPMNLRRLTHINKIVREIRNAPYNKGSKCTVTVRSIKL